MPFRAVSDRCPACQGWLYADRDEEVRCLNCGRTPIPLKVGTLPNVSRGRYAKKQGPRHAGRRL